MVEFIRAENIKALVSHLVEKFGAELAEVDYVDTFQALRLKYDQVRSRRSRRFKGSRWYDRLSAVCCTLRGALVVLLHGGNKPSRRPSLMGLWRDAALVTGPADR